MLFDELKYRIVRNDEGVFYYNSNDIETMTCLPSFTQMDHRSGGSMGDLSNVTTLAKALGLCYTVFIAAIVLQQKRSKHASKRNQE